MEERKDMDAFLKFNLCAFTCLYGAGHLEPYHESITIKKAQHILVSMRFQWNGGFFPNPVVWKGSTFAFTAEQRMVHHN